jgi:hypothetical protein
MFDFPSSPSTGTIYSPAGGPVYMWDGTTWNIVDATAFVSGCIKISEGTLGANAATIEIPMPTSGYNMLELLGQNLQSGVSSNSFLIQFAVADVYNTTQYQYAWDQIMATGNASAGWTAGSSGSGYQAWGMLIPYVSPTINGTFFRTSFPMGHPTGQEFICDSYGFGTGWQRCRSGGYSSAVGAPNKLKLLWSNADTIKAGFKWQLMGYR